MDLEKPLVLTEESRFCLFGWGFVFRPKYNREKGMTLAGLIGEKAIAKVGQATELSGAFCETEVKFCLSC